MVDPIKKFFNVAKYEWVNQPSIVLVVEKAIKAHATDSESEFHNKLTKMGKVGRAGLAISLECQIEEEKNADRMATLQAILATVRGYHD